MTRAKQFSVVLVTTCVLPVVAMAQGSASSPAPAAAVVGHPAMSTATPTDYVIGAEDVLGVLFWRDQEMSGDIIVRPDGRITLPLIGEMQAAGVRPDVLRGHIQTAADKYLSDTNVTIVVRQVNSRKVYITGQVATAGPYPLTGPRTVMQLIALAGGVSEYADSANITVIRSEGGQTRSFKFNYKDVSRGKKLEQNIQLQPGDTVVVP